VIVAQSGETLGQLRDISVAGLALQDCSALSDRRFHTVELQLPEIIAGSDRLTLDLHCLWQSPAAAEHTAGFQWLEAEPPAIKRIEILIRDYASTAK